MIVIWCDWKGELYAFCRSECQRHYEVSVCDPNYLFEKATWTDASFGCVWCGGDLTGGVEWLSEEHVGATVQRSAPSRALISALDREEAVSRYGPMGGHFLSKPFDPWELIRILNELLPPARTREEASHAPAPEGRGP